MLSSVTAFLLIAMPLAASQNSFQCGDGTFSFVPVVNGRQCPCSTDSFLEFVNTGCPVPATPEQNDGSIYLAGLLDLTSYWWAEDIFQVTVDLYNEGFFTDVNGQPMNNRTVTYKLRDSKCDETEVIRAYWKLRQENDDTPPDGVVGTRCSGPAMSLASIGRRGCPSSLPWRVSRQIE